MPDAPPIPGPSPAVGPDASPDAGPAVELALAAGEGGAEDAGGRRWVVTCDHASNAVPPWVSGGSLGLPAGDMGRHIALDVGAAGLARGLARRLGAPCLLARFSRLVIDPNRGEDDPTLVMRLYDGSVVPANRRLAPADVEERLDRLHRPYHAALSRLLAERPRAALLAVHSFTPQLRGRAPRPWQVGVLHSHRDGRLAVPLIARLRAEGLAVGDNEPYSGHLPGDSVDRHALGTGRPNVLLEVRNDLIASPEAQEEWAARLAPHLEGALGDMEEA